MKRFSWPLDRLLNLRSFREKEAEIELGRAVAERDRLQFELDSVARRRVEATRSRTQNLSVNELLSIEHYVRRLDGERDRLFESIAKAELEVDLRRKKYIEASRDRNVLSRLREKKEADWRRKYLADEAAILDDVASGHDRALKAEEERDAPPST